MFDYLANPTRFMRLADWLLRPLALLATGLLLAGLYFGLVTSPPDYQQGDTVRIMYVHVPAAWLASPAGALRRATDEAPVLMARRQPRSIW